MNILVDRTNITDKFTEGKLYINNEYFCDTLENPDRGLYQGMPVSQINQLKVPKETAIPTGTYSVNLNIQTTYSNASHRLWYKQTAMKGVMPMIMNIPGFAGILIHYGTSTAWTEGCLLVGVKSTDGNLKSDRSTIYKLYEIFAAAKARNEKVTITIQDNGTSPVGKTGYEEVEYDNVTINFGATIEELEEEEARQSAQQTSGGDLMDQIKNLASQLGDQLTQTEEATTDSEYTYEVNLSDTIEELDDELIDLKETSDVPTKISNSDILSGLYKSLPNIPGLNTDSIIDSILKNDKTYKTNIENLEKSAENITKQEQEEQQRKEDLGDNYIKKAQLYTKSEIEKVKSDMITQYKSNLKPQIDRSILKIKMSYQNILNGIDSIKSSISNFSTSQLIPSTLVAGSATGTANPAYTALQLKIFKSQLSNLIGPLLLAMIEIINTSDEIQFKIPDSITMTFKALIALKTTIDKL